MKTPAQRHWHRVTAEEQARLAPELAMQSMSDAQQLMLAKLYADTRTLKDIQSQEAKIARKRELLPAYAAHVEGAIAGGTRQDDVMMTVMVWHIDVQDFKAALTIARHAIANHVPMPDRFQRNTATVLAEEVADAMLARGTIGEAIDGEILIDVATLVEDQDMPDQVRAKLFKALGQFYEPTDDAAALDAYTRAFQLNKNIGVKKNIEQLTRKVRKEQAAP